MGRALILLVAILAHLSHWGLALVENSADAAQAGYILPTGLGVNSILKLDAAAEKKRFNDMIKMKMQQDASEFEREIAAVQNVGFDVSRFQCSSSTDARSEWLKEEHRTENGVSYVRLCVQGSPYIAQNGTTFDDSFEEADADFRKKRCANVAKITTEDLGEAVTVGARRRRRRRRRLRSLHLQQRRLRPKLVHGGRARWSPGGG